MSLRVMTYNILDGGENRETHILEVIQTAKPDVVILQEVFTEDFLKFLSHALGMNYYLGTGNKKRRVAVISKFPVHTFKSHHPVFPIWRNFIDAEIEYKPSKTTRVIGVHPMANLGIVFEIWRMWEARYVINHIRNFQNEPCLIAGDFNAIAPGEKVKRSTCPIGLSGLYSCRVIVFTTFPLNCSCPQDLQIVSDFLILKMDLLSPRQIQMPGLITFL